MNKSAIISAITADLTTEYSHSEQAAIEGFVSGIRDQVRQEFEVLLAEAEQRRLRDLAQLQERLEKEHQKQIQAIYEEIRIQRMRLFGRSSESHPGQLSLFDEAEVAAAETPDASDEATIPPAELQKPADHVQGKTSPRKRGQRKPIPAHLPRLRIVLDLPEGERVCPCCQNTMSVIGEEVSEQLDVIPMQMRVLQFVRMRYGCSHREHAPVIAPRAGQVLPKSNASGQFLAMLLTMKYLDGLPLARMEYILGRMGVRVSRATLARWVIQAAEQMKPLIDRLQARLMTSPVIQMDETPVQVLKEPDRDPSTKSYMWVQRGGPPDKPIVLYHYAPSRSSQVPLKLLEGWKGYLMVDGYAGYDAVGRQPGVEHMACWVHARRGFMDAMKLQPKGQHGRADEMIAMVAELYAIEKNHRHEDDAVRLQARQSESQKVLDRIRAWLDLHQPVTPPKSALGEAISYMDKYWPRLSRYIERGDLPIDNNASENAIRPFVMGRKAWLFSDTPAGADASALIYSLVETAKANGLEPWTWLCRVMRDLPDIRVTGQWDSLLPWNFRGDELITQAYDSKAPTS